ncbi:MAG: hypothetical protein CMP36_04265 [Rickettsiales bacterium]|nr:hypothetical protein [Rickettsiales bacterium]|tara:strand:- start:209 stop:1075 length:867 start_codon:yes stop_codon:yes gene_type:complete
MIITHKMSWDKCLSHKIWPAIEKGWQDEDKEIHFFWGLGGKNTELIRECTHLEKEWWYVDVGYLNAPFVRYPEPIVDWDRFYIRIAKGNLHTIRGRVGDGKRISQLEHEGIDCQFKGWDTGKPKHILLAPSSSTVTFHINGCSVEKWTEIATHQINQFLKGTEHEGLPIKFRNKPRPGNEFWNTDIRADLQGAHALVTNMSLSAIDAILNMTPVFAHKRNIVSFIAGQHIGKIAKPMRPGHKTVNEWLKMVVDNQFKLSEIADGTAYEMLMQQPNNKLEPKQIQDQIK